MQKPPVGFEVEGRVFTGGDPDDGANWQRKFRDAPPIGFKVEGRVYKGGDPDDGANWVNTSRRRGALETANDTAIAAGNAVVGLGKAAVDFFSPGSGVSQALGGFIEDGQSKQSDVVQAERLRLQREVEDAEGIAGEVGATLQYIARNPLQSAAEMFGSFGPVVGITRGASRIAAGRVLAKGGTKEAAEKAGERAAVGVGVGVGAIAGGGDAAGEAYDLVMQATPEMLANDREFQSLVSRGMSAEEAQKQLANSAANQAKVIPALVGGAFGAFGLERLAGGGAGYAGNAFSRFAKGAAVEGTQEAIEEGGALFEAQRAAAPINTDVELGKGVASAATMGAVLGAGPGGTLGALSPQRSPIEQIANAQTAQEAIDAALANSTLELETPKLADLISQYRSNAIDLAEADPMSLAAPATEQNGLVTLGAAEGLQVADTTIPESGNQIGQAGDLGFEPAANELVTRLASDIRASGTITPTQEQFLRGTGNTQLLQTLQAEMLQGQKRSDINQPEVQLDEVSAFVNIMAREQSPAARAFTADFNAGKITTDDVRQSLFQQRRGGNEVQTRITAATEGRAPTAQTGVQPADVMTPMARTPALQEAVRMYGNLPLTQADQRENFTTRLGDAASQALPALPSAVDQASVAIEAAANQAPMQTGAAVDQSFSSPTVDAATDSIQAAAQEGQKLKESKGTGKIITLNSAPRGEVGQVVKLPGGVTVKYVDESSLGLTSKVELNEDGTVKNATLSKLQYKTISTMLSLIGKRVQLFESDNAGDGFVVRDTDRKTIFLNTKGTINPLSVAMHELLHIMAVENPDGYDSLLKVILKMVSPEDRARFAQYYGQVKVDADGKPVVDKEGRPVYEFDQEELVADTFGSVMSDPQMWTDVFADIQAQYGSTKAQSIIAKMVASINKVINALLKTFKNGDFITVQSYVAKTEQELIGVKAAVRQAAVEYFKQQRMSPMVMEGKIIQAERDVQLNRGSQPGSQNTQSSGNGSGIGSEPGSQNAPGSAPGQNAVDTAEVEDPIGENLENIRGLPFARFSKARVIFEVAPDPNDLSLKAKWDGYDQIEKTRISKEVLNEIMPFVAKAAGLKPEEVTGQIGGYLDDSNPSFTAVFDKQKLSIGKVLRLTKLAGFALSQDSMMVVAEKPFEGSFETGFITLTLPNGVDKSSIDDVHAVYKQLRALDPESIQGHTTVGNEMGLAVPADKMQDILQKIRALPNVTFPDMDNSIRHMAFPSKEEYDYGSSTGNNGSGTELAAERQAGADLRARAEQALKSAFERRNLAPKVPRSSVPLRDKDGVYVRRQLGLIAEPSGRNINKVRPIAEAFDRYLKRMESLPVIEKDNFSEEARDEIAAAIADEIAYQTQGSNTGLGWYSSNYPKSLKKLGKRFPELKTNENARMIFSAFVAITSNGENVATNAANAVRLYGEYRSGTSVADLAISSRRADGMLDGLMALDRLLKEKPLGQIKGYLLDELTVKQMNSELRARGEKPDGSYKADTKVPRSAVIFGPKIGAFFANLMGSEGYLTMDLWWTRSINRMRGLLIPSPTESSIDTLRQLLMMPDASESEVVEAARPYRDTYEANNFKSDLELIMNRKEGKNDEEKKAFNQEAAEKLGKDYPELYRLNRLQKAANTVLKNEDIINEAPENASDREFMYGIARKAQNLLKQNSGMDLTLADIQAALWYYEKKLYEAMSGKKAKDIGYDEAISRLGDSGEETPSVRKFKPSDKEQAVKRSTARATQEYMQIARENPALFSFPTSNSKDFKKIISETMPGLRADDMGWLAEEEGADRGWAIAFKGRGDAYILEEGDKVWVNLASLKSGDGGSRVYAAVANYAFNTGKKFIGDPQGISPAGMRRRVENLASSAIKFGTAKHLGLHPKMKADLNIEFGDNDLENIETLLNKSYELTSRAAPEIKDVQYDFAASRFVRDGDTVSDREFDEIASGLRSPVSPAAQREGAPGRRTLKAAVLWQSLVQGSDRTIGGSVPAEPRIRAGQLAGSVLDGIRYSRTRQTDAPEFKRWFGDSKVVDSDGEPLVVYHGTMRDIGGGVFRDATSGPVSLAFFTDEAKTAGVYARGFGRAYTTGSNILPVYLSIKNPKILDFGDRGDDADIRAEAYLAADQGHDGMIVYNAFDGRQSATQYISFDPTQIKSAIGNNGQFDPANPDIRRSTRRSPLGFYSKLDQAIGSAPKFLKTGDQWAQWVTGGKLRELGVKKEEIEWSGLVDYLQLKGKESVTLEDVQAYVQSNGVQVVETNLREAEDLELASQRMAEPYGIQVEMSGEEMEFYDEDGDFLDFDELPEQLQRQLESIQDSEVAKYASYKTPGGTNYREVLLRLPAKLSLPAGYRVKPNPSTASNAKKFVVVDSAGERYGSGDTEQEALDRYFANHTPNSYKSSHWDQPNVLAHLRLQDFTDSTGAKVLFVDEVQSDWGQDGKKKGFKTDKSPRKATTANRMDGYWEVLDQNGEFITNIMDYALPDADEAKALQVADARLQAQNASNMAQSTMPPPAPFVTDTKGWLNLALKRIITIAAQEGYDKVAFINGEQSADRYDLSKQVDSISWAETQDGKFNVAAFKDGSRMTGQDGLSADQLEDMLGKDVAAKIVESAKTEVAGELTGVDLKVGGKGMIAFYDKIVPQEVRGLIKKFDGMMAPVSLAIESEKTGNDIDREAQQYFGMTSNQWNNQLTSERQQKIDEYRSTIVPDSMVQPGFTVTDKMKEVVKSEGLPLFSRKRQTDMPQFKQWFGDSKVVDENGEPLVVYHGTNKQIKGFKEGKPAWFAQNPELANMFVGGGRRSMGKKSKSGSAVYPVYLSLKNPLDLTSMTPASSVSVKEILQIAGLPNDKAELKRIAQRNLDLGFSFASDSVGDKAEYFAQTYSIPYRLSDVLDDKGLIETLKGNDFDGFLLKENGSSTFAVFSPAQIKSAIGNNGQFDPANPDIRFSRDRAAQKDPGNFRDRQDFKDRTIRTEKVQEALQDFVDGKISREDYELVVDTYRPVKPYEFIPEPASSDKAVYALSNGKGQSPEKGAKYGVPMERLVEGESAQLRLDIPSYNIHDTWVVSVHKPDTENLNVESAFKAGKVVGYESAASVTDARFGMTQKAAENIGLGVPKATIATVVGKWKPIDPGTAYTRAQEALNSSDWVQVGMDPFRHSYFYDRDSMRPVISADEVIQIGPLVLAKNPVMGNSSDINPDGTPKYRFSRGRESFKLADSSKYEDILYKLQDKNIDLKRVTEAVKAKSGEIQDEINAYQKEEVYHGRVAKQSEDFLTKELKPLLEEMRIRKVSRKDFETYLWNRHAPEANRQLAKVNDRLPDGGSGIMTADALRYMQSLPASKREQYEILAKRIDKISAENLRLSVEAGLEKQESVDAMRGAYKYYVPLFRSETSSSAGNGTGSGFSVSGATTKRRTGSEKPVDDIIAGLAMQRDNIITRAEKAVVGRALMGMALENPQDDFWFVFDPLLNDPKKNPGQMEKLRDQLESMGVDPDLAEQITQQPYKEELNKLTNKVRRVPNRLMKMIPNAVAVRIDGEDKYIVFNKENPRAKRMAEAITNFDSPQLGYLMGMSAKFSRYFSSINTQYNPVFGAFNFLRDVQGALLNLSTTELAGDQKKVLAGASPSKLLEIAKYVRARREGRTPTGEWAQMYERFLNAGGQTGFRDMFESPAERTKKQINRELDPEWWYQAADKAAGPVFRWLSDYNEVLENAVRVSAFSAALDKGMSEDKAASLAKNLTVNFNRKGQMGTQAGALYAFFNAAVQGNARLMETLKGPAGKKILAGGVLLGAIQPIMLAMAGFDEEQPPDFIRERSIIIPTGDGDYFAWPMPLGFHVIPNVGRIITEQLMGRTQDNVVESFGKMLLTVSQAFNPIGAGTLAQTVTPTPFDPIMALSENKDGMGRSISREDFNPNKPTPGYTRSRDNTPELLSDIAYVINVATGGTAYTQGIVSPTGDQLDYLLGQFTGGVGREVSKSIQFIETSFTGEELPSYKVPLFGKFYGETQSQAGQIGVFYGNMRTMNDHKLEIMGRAEAGEDYQSYLAENPEARLFRVAEKVERQIQKLNERKRMLKDAEASPEDIKRIEETIRMVASNFNAQVRAAREAVRQ